MERNLELELEILNASYWEHFKWAKELAGYLPLKNHKRVKLEKILNEMIDERHRLANEIKENELTRK